MSSKMLSGGGSSTSLTCSGFFPSSGIAVLHDEAPSLAEGAIKQTIAATDDVRACRRDQSCSCSGDGDGTRSPAPDDGRRPVGTGENSAAAHMVEYALNLPVEL